MKVLCVIPSRMGSTRLPRKPLSIIQGKPMIQWVYENAARCPLLDKIIVATDHEEIADVVTKCGGTFVMTDPDLPTGTDRVAVVARSEPEMDVVINLQGDEPFIKPSMLEQLLSPYIAGELPVMTTLAYPLDMKTKYFEAGSVKVITDLQNNAIYFSRAPIPYFKTEARAPVYNHMGIYAFTRDFLLHYTTLAQTPLEKIESLEQLRALEHGYKIRVCLTESRTLEINTAEELAEAANFAHSV
jgi:3-deoxy-manno-octulosonate cytidylyltransferase (CMP-KDO synthetase)